MVCAGSNLDVAGLEEGGELVDLVLHAEAEQLAGGIAAAVAGAGAGPADGEVEAFAFGVWGRRSR